ncbi:unnamed protein product [Rotaria sordida]|uniref:TUG ubiquitin-like domain-containing protein n=1 Tax=Rotaria sordida TaxID=392033 RepID=A0A814WVJ9_9BILA|nr:unnamed protein product [Rotaria sordida]CAF1483045.1 unnamed protein product [Rotaria sordida]
MSKATITILCPSGHRRKVQMTPNSNLLQALEDMCNQEKLDSSEWGLIHQRKKCDLTVPWRLASIPTNALLEMYKLEERRPTSDVTVQLQIPDNSRYTGNFNPSITLQEMLDWYRNQSERWTLMKLMHDREFCLLYPMKVFGEKNNMFRN